MKKSVEVFNLFNDSFSRVITSGTIEDLRTYMKNRWKENKALVNKIFPEFITEEEYYTHLDNDDNLIMAIDEFDYIINSACFVYLTDFEN